MISNKQQQQQQQMAISTNSESNYVLLNGTKASYDKPPRSYVFLEVFKDHWKQILQVFSKSLINDDDVETVKNNYDQMILLLINELNEQEMQQQQQLLQQQQTDNHQQQQQQPHQLGPILSYVFNENIFETTFLWSLSYPEYLYELKYSQLKYYENLLSNSSILLNYRQFYRPLFSLLNHCSKHKSIFIEKHMIVILNQLCVSIGKNVELMSIFFEQSQQPQQQQMSSSSSPSSANGISTPNRLKSASSLQQFSTDQQGPAKFLIFSLLIPYIHQDGFCGQQARDALLMIMQISSRNYNLAKYVVESTDFCPILATGLSGLYSELPQKLGQNGEEVYMLGQDDIKNIPTLGQFINSLEFCNNVIQVSHTLISNQLLQYLYHGFLIPVIAPALNQISMDEVIAATAYFDLFLRTINEDKCLKLFLKFILYTKIDELTLLEILINRINSNNKLSLVTLMLFYTIIDLNSEDAMYKLILSYLIPCKHMMKSQINSLKDSLNTTGKNAEYLLSLQTMYATNTKQIISAMNKHQKPSSASMASTLSTPSTDTNNNTNNANNSVAQAHYDSLTIALDWYKSLHENRTVSDQVLNYNEDMRFNFVSYLKDARVGIYNCKKKCVASWQNQYDGSCNNINELQTNQNSNLVDTDEYLLNLVTNTSSDLDMASNKLANSTNKNETNSINTRCNEDTGSVKQETESDSRRVTADNAEDIENYLNQIISTSNVFYADDDSVLNEAIHVSRKSKSYKKDDYSSKYSSKNDFYVLSFDNELSPSISPESSSSSSESSTRSNSPTVLKSKPQQELSKITEMDNEELEYYRQLIINIFFESQSTIESYFNTNLNSFLSGLDKFDLKRNGSSKKNVESIDSLCEQIVKLTQEVNHFNERPYLKPLDLNTYDSVNDTNEEKSEFKLVSFKSIEQLATTPTKNLIQSHSSVENISQQTSGNADIGPFLRALFTRLEQMLTNSLQINFLITGLIARLCFYPQPLLRSFLLDNNLVLQSNVKSLIQVLTTLKSKIDSCSLTYNNFTILYMQGKLSLVKRLIESKSLNAIKHMDNDVFQNNNLNNYNATSSSTSRSGSASLATPNPNGFVATNTANNNTNNRNNKQNTKISDKIMSFFKWTSAKLNLNDEFNNNSQNRESQNSHVMMINDHTMKFINNNSRLNQKSSNTDSIPMTVMHNGAYISLLNDWDDLKTRNIAFAAVIYDEFLKELASICEEHCVQQF